MITRRVFLAGLALSAAAAVQELPRVLLIGDSISIGYSPYVKEMLRGKAIVEHHAGNGGPTSNGLIKIDQWIGSMKWDVIHFNFGLHDLKIGGEEKRQVPLEEYAANLRKIVVRLKQTKARLIWAATTPVPDAKLNPPRLNADVIAYNRVARQIMEENGIEINDLYAQVHPALAELQLPANVHFTKPGYEFLAQAVVKAIH